MRTPALLSSINSRNGSEITSSGFIAIAPDQSKCTSEYRQRVLPQPGQYNPVNAYSGQPGSGLLPAYGLTWRSTTVAPTASPAVTASGAQRDRVERKGIVMTAERPEPGTLRGRRTGPSVGDQ